MNRSHLMILELLIGENKSVEAVSFQLNISERTLSNYVIQINDYFDSSIHIQKKHGKYALIVNDNQQFKTAFQKLRSDMRLLEYERELRRAQLFHQLVNQEKTIIDELAEKLHLSKSVIHNIINDLKEIALTYSVDIIGTPNVGLRVRGNEFNIRKMLINQFYRYYTEFPTPEYLINQIEDIKKIYHLDEESVSRLTASLNVMLIRLDKGYPIDYKLNIDQKIFESEDYSNFSALTQFIASEYAPPNTNNEILLLVMQVLGRRASIVDDIISNTDQTLLTLIIQNTIDDISNDFKIKIDENLFSKDIKLHLKYLINRVIFDIELHNDSLGDVQQKFPLAFELSKVLAKNIEKFVKVDVPINELGFLAIYFSIFLEELNEKLSAIKKIAIITDQGLSTSKMIRTNLKSIINQENETNIFMHEEIDKSNFADYDLIISTIKVNRLFNKLIFIEDILDKKLLKLKIEQFLIYKDVSREIMINQNVLLDYFNEDDVLYINQDMSYREAIEYLSNQLINEKKVDSEFMERILKREQDSATISNYLGFPHSTHNYQDIHFKIAILKNGVTDNKDIKIIVLMAIADSYENEAMLIRLYEEILSLSTNQFVLSNISIKTTYNDLAYLLNQERRG